MKDYVNGVKHPCIRKPKKVEFSELIVRKWYAQGKTVK